MWPHPHLIGRGRLLCAPPATTIPADLNAKVPLGAFTAFDSDSALAGRTWRSHGTEIKQAW